MLADIRVIEKDGKTILQKFGPVKMSGLSEDGYMTFNLKDYEWQDVCEIGEIKKVFNLELAS